MFLIDASVPVSNKFLFDADEDEEEIEMLLENCLQRYHFLPSKFALSLSLSLNFLLLEMKR